MRSKKKGFTLVELLVVIAILAVLATVTTVGYLSFTEKAKESNDESLVRQLNTVLQGEEAYNKINTMHDAINILEENGFVVEKLTPTSAKNEFVYNETTNRFSVVKVEDVNANTAERSNEWLVVQTESRLEQVTNYYSVYLGTNFVEDVTNDNIVNVKHGLDVGTNKSLEKVNLDNQTTKNATLRTNGQNIMVNTPLATVKSYGEINNADIVAVDPNNSFHLFGNSLKLDIKKGNLVLEDNCKPGDIIVSAITKGDVKIEVKVNVTVNIVAKDPSVIEGNITTQDNVKPVVNSITEVSTFDELKTAISSDGVKYVSFKNDISYPNIDTPALDINSSITIDGNGYTLNGRGIRGSHKPTLLVNNSIDDDSTVLNKVAIKNLIINNDGYANAYCLETRGNLESLVLENCKLNLKHYSGNATCLKIGGKQLNKFNLSINKTKLNGGNDDYPIMAYNPFDLMVDNSYFQGYCGIFYKGKDGSTGTYGSTAKIYNSYFECPNVHEKGSNDFGVFVFRDHNISIDLYDVKVNSLSLKESKQDLLMLNSGSGIDLNKGNNIKLTLNDNCLIHGTFINNHIWGEINNPTLVINGGSYSFDPSNFVDSTHNVSKEGIYWIVK